MSVNIDFPLHLIKYPVIDVWRSECMVARILEFTCKMKANDQL
jgi:hypothetical protein